MQNNEVKEDSNDGHDSPLKTPQTLVTEDNVKAALMADKGGSASLTSLKVVDFTQKGDNYACVVSSVEVKYMLDGQSYDVTYVVKLNPCRHYESMKDFNTVIFEKEAKFYLDFLPAANSILMETGDEKLKFPRCIYANLEKGKEIIFFEDLRALGFKMADRRKPLDKDHSMLVFKELARLHAASVLMRTKTPEEHITDRYSFLKKDWGYFLRTGVSFKSVFETQLKSSKQFLDKVGGYERASAWVDSMIPNINDIIEEQVETGNFKVVCHGDTWCNNLLFRYDEEGHPVDIKLLDLQLCNYSSPCTDLNYFLYSSTNGEVRNNNLETFFDAYYSKFCSVLEANKHEIPFSKSDLQQSFREKNVYGALFSMVLLPFMIMEPDDVIDLEKGTDETLQEQLNDMTDKVLINWENNTVLRTRFLSMFDDMLKAGVIE